MGDMILIVEDEEKLAGLMADYLRQDGFRTASLNNGAEVTDWVREHKPALVLLDVMLPGKSGFDVCRELRSFSDVPVIMTTARIEEIDRLLGLGLGADDYICKPFSPREVVARVKAVLRRLGGGKAVPAQGLQLDEARHLAVLDGQILDLTFVEFKLLHFLATHQGRIYGRQQLMDHIYPDERVVADRTIDSHIKKLRKKLAAASPETEFIQSVYGVGYKFEKGHRSG
ncbi:response regulator [Geobacter sp. SVR]|uniref:response regulator n=1 Tax=Geobacter sp. SVR TaxID=2495594 RepID=UPI00143EFCAC|nr:response regulator [Geobacter sp. SVR]GCF84684.1 DNA-binding response regulator [Geobacter sp. SVR]